MDFTVDKVLASTIHLVSNRNSVILKGIESVNNLTNNKTKLTFPVLARNSHLCAILGTHTKYMQTPKKVQFLTHALAACSIPS